jgi:hypothetical protein
MKYSRSFLLVPIAVVVSLCAAEAARATTIIPVSDDDLALSSAVIVEGRVVRLDPALDAERGVVYTYVTFNVTRVIKGDLEPGRVVLKQLGGVTADGATVIWGAPYWQQDWRMLLYLNPGPDGALRVAHLSAGYFRIIQAPSGRLYAERPDPGPNVDVLPGATAVRVTNHAPYDGYLARLEATLAAHPQPPVAFRPIPTDCPDAAKRGGGRTDFRFLGDGFRWFEPDTGGRVVFRVNSRNAPLSSGGVDEASAAAAAWSSVPGSSLRVEISGSTTACGIKADGASAISFADCAGMFDDPVNCTGVVALGGVASATPSQSVSIGGKRFSRITDADVTFNRGFDDCLFAARPEVVSEIMTHEMGHALGFGHASERLDESNTVLREATMFFAIHNDGRGGALRDDDMDAARFLYRAAAGNGAMLAIVTDALPDAQTGAAYAFDLQASGSGPFTWSVADGQLPAGLTLSPSGRISGTASADETATFTVRVRDNANFEQTRTLELRVAADPAPFVVSAVFKPSGKLILKATNVDATATISVNGVDVAPPRPVKFKASKGQIVVSGGAGDLNVRAAAANTVVVTVAGRASNAFAF